jgi:hypothetical protein
LRGRAGQSGRAGDDAGRNGPRWGHPQPHSGEGASVRRAGAGR